MVVNLLMFIVLYIHLPQTLNSIVGWVGGGWWMVGTAGAEEGIKTRGFNEARWELHTEDGAANRPHTQVSFMPPPAPTMV